jgi:hypothetical protein
VTDDQWHAARAALTSRRLKGGRPAPRVNLFTNLLHDARDGGSLHQINKGEKASGPGLVSYKATQGTPGAKYVTFPLEVFERSILSELREIDPRDVMPPDDGAADKVLALTGRLTETESRIEQVKAQLVDGGDLAPLVDVLRTLEDRRARAADELATAKREAATPLSGAWGEYPSVLSAIDAAPDVEEARVRLRSVLRRMIDGVWCLFVGHGRTRLAAVQIWFTGGAHRDYLIVHQPPHGNAAAKRKAETEVRSFAEVDAGSGLDLRKRKDAKALAKVLENLPD